MRGTGLASCWPIRCSQKAGLNQLVPERSANGLSTHTPFNPQDYPVPPMNQAAEEELLNRLTKLAFTKKEETHKRLLSKHQPEQVPWLELCPYAPLTACGGEGRGAAR